jgi:hypothetical protein
MPVVKQPINSLIYSISSTRPTNFFVLVVEEHDMI